MSIRDRNTYFCDEDLNILIPGVKDRLVSFGEEKVGAMSSYDLSFYRLSHASPGDEGLDCFLSFLHCKDKPPGMWSYLSPESLEDGSCVTLAFSRAKDIDVLIGILERLKSDRLEADADRKEESTRE